MHAQVLVYDQIAANRTHSYLLMANVFVLTCAGAVAVCLLSGLPLSLAPFALLVAGGFVTLSYFGADTVALRVARARRVDPDTEPVLHNLVENLCIGCGLPLPAVYVIEDGATNAFATGRDPAHASVAVTRGLLNKLDRRELEGVLAHELSHIANRDTLVMGTVLVLLGTLALLSDLGLRVTHFGAGTRRSYSDDDSKASVFVLVAAAAFLIASPLIARLMTLAVSREREYLADASGALLTRNPEGLAAALEKIGADTDPLDHATKGTAHLYFVNPLAHHRSTLNALFSTHPPIEHRIQLLRAM